MLWDQKLRGESLRTIVEGMLPAQFLLDLGVYMQTAAHIELVVWQTTMHAEGIDLHSAEEYRRYVELKFLTKGLLKRYRESADFCPVPIADRIRASAHLVEVGLETRNLAAHGAFFPDDEVPGVIGAAHYFARGVRKERELFEVKQAVTQQTVEDTLRIANQLLHEVISIRTAVIGWRFPAGMPEPTRVDSE